MAGGAKVTKIKFLSKGFQEALNLQAVADELLRHGRGIAGIAGEGFGVRLSKTDRARVIVGTDTLEARKAEAKDKRLTRAIGAVGRAGQRGG